MICPKCLHEKTQIYNSRFTKQHYQTWRRRRCLNCKFVFSTQESIDLSKILFVSLDAKRKQPYSRTKLLLSLAEVCDHLDKKPDIAFYLLENIEHKLLQQQKNNLIPKANIIAACLKVLQAFDTKAYIKYLASQPDLQDNRDLRRFLKKLP